MPLMRFSIIDNGSKFQLKVSSLNCPLVNSETIIKTMLRTQYAINAIKLRLLAKSCPIEIAR